MLGRKAVRTNYPTSPLKWSRAEAVCRACIELLDRLQYRVEGNMFTPAMIGAEHSVRDSRAATKHWDRRVICDSPSSRALCRPRKRVTAFLRSAQSSDDCEAYTVE